MKAISLFLVLAVAKFCWLAGGAPVLTPLSVVALLWQDAVVATAFAAIEWILRNHRRVIWIVYLVHVAYIAINVPIARLTSSPLTAQMIRATGSALSDSLTHHLTIPNLGLMLITILLGVALPLVMRVVSPSPSGRGQGEGILRPRFVLPILLLLGVAGALASSRVSLHGFERNAITALALSLLPRVESRPTLEDWRASAFSYPSDPDLSHLKGAARGRNVVLIALESTGGQYLQPYGAMRDPMPHLTELSRAAILFENAYAVYPESIKGLFSVLCSTYPAFDSQPEDYAGVSTPSIARALGHAGYRTALFHSGRFMYLGMRSIIERRGFDLLEDAGHIGGNHNSSFGIDEPSTVRRMLNWTSSLKPDERFFLFYLPIAGHHPYETPADGPFPDNNEQGRYLNALHYSDAAIAELLRGLKEQGRYTNTLFVLYGDHGEAFGQHHGNFGHTFFLYEENVRVPLMIIAPGLVHAPTRIANPASLVDIAPTIASLLGILGASWQGLSLLDSAPRNALFFTDYSLPLVGLRDGPWKFISETSGSGAQMFHLARDPGETHGPPARSPVAANYHDRLARWAGAQKALLRP